MQRDKNKQTNQQLTEHLFHKPCSKIYNKNP